MKPIDNVELWKRLWKLEMIYWHNPTRKNMEKMMKAQAEIDKREGHA